MATTLDSLLNITYTTHTHIYTVALQKQFVDVHPNCSAIKPRYNGNMQNVQAIKNNFMYGINPRRQVARFKLIIMTLRKRSGGHYDSLEKHV